MRGANCSRCADETGGIDDFLNCGWAHAIAGCLDHLIPAADEIEETLGVAAHDVAGPHGDFGQANPRGLARCRPVSLSCSFGVLPIAKRNQCAAVDELAGLVDVTEPTVRMNDQNLGVGDRLPD